MCHSSVLVSVVGCVAYFWCRGTELRTIRLSRRLFFSLCWLLLLPSIRNSWSVCYYGDEYSLISVWLSYVSSSSYEVAVGIDSFR
jgi:hypothetical protein